MSQFNDGMISQDLQNSNRLNKLATEAARNQLNFNIVQENLGFP